MRRLHYTIYCTGGNQPPYHVDVYTDGTTERHYEPIPCFVPERARGHYIAACGAGFKTAELRNAHDAVFQLRATARQLGPYR